MRGCTGASFQKGRLPWAPVSSRELDAAGITDPALRASYLACRALNATHGKTYYLATLLLPAGKRPFVHALYGFARYADEVVDDVSSTASPRQRAATLDRLRDTLVAGLAAGRSDHPVLAAVVDTATRWSVDAALFAAFLDSMAMDVDITEYPTYADLSGYVYGSAAVIGLQMLPILQPVAPGADAAARDLGTAFQLANFCRDVGEDLDRGRLYLPLEDLDRFGLTRADVERRVVDDRFRALMAFQVARVRRLADAAEPGIAALHPSSRPCIQAARVLYCGIADQVEAIDYQVFTRRATVGLPTRARVAGAAWVRAVAARRADPPRLPAPR